MPDNEQDGDRDRECAHGEVFPAPGTLDQGEVARHKRQGAGDRGQRDVAGQEKDDAESDSRGRAREWLQRQQGTQAGGHSLASLESEINWKIVAQDRCQGNED